MSRDELGSELDRNQTILKKINNNIVLRNFAYPYGDMSVGTKRYLEARFDTCRSGHAGINTGVADLGALHAWPLDNANLDRAKIAELIAETVQTRGWLISPSAGVGRLHGKASGMPTDQYCRRR